MADYEYEEALAGWEKAERQGIHPWKRGRALRDALKVSAERDRLRRAITEALDHDPLHGRSEGLHCGGMSPCIRGILGAALDKEGQTDEHPHQ